jgi:putative tricarboxylic transport membrane protein
MNAKRAQLFVGAGVVALGLLVARQAMLIPVAPIYARVGPTVFPYLVAAALVLLGGLLAWQASSGQWGETDAETDAGPPDRRALAWLGIGLVLNVALIDLLGFVIASSILFVCTARAFGSRHLVRDALIALALTIVVYLGFDRLLGISVGAGALFEGLL